MGGQRYAFLDAFGAVYALMPYREHVPGQNLEKFIYTDLNQMFDSITRVNPRQIISCQKTYQLPGKHIRKSKSTALDGSEEKIILRTR